MQWAILGALFQSATSLSRALGGAGITSPLRIGLPSLWRAIKLVLLVVLVDVAFSIVVYLLLPYIKLDSTLQNLLDANQVVGYLALGFGASQTARLIPGMIPRERQGNEKSNSELGVEYLSRFLRNDWLKQIAAIVDVRVADRIADWRNECRGVWNMAETRQDRLVELCNTHEWREPLPPAIVEQAEKLHGVTEMESKSTEVDALFISCLDAGRWQLLEAALKIRLK